MDQRLSIVTLGVKDLAAARLFYESTLGWKPIGEDPGIAFYNAGSVIVALFPEHELAADIGVPASDPAVAEYRGFTVAINLASRAAVDSLFDELRAGGVRIQKEPHEVFWGGYSGYFADPDGHHWEVAHNPFWEVGSAGWPVAPG
jgi:uncharacterized protein